MRIVTYAVVGPAVGCVGFHSLSAVLDPSALSEWIERTSLATTASMFVLALLVTLAAFYVVGWKAAVLTGFVMALAEPRLKHPAGAYACAAVVGGAACALYFPVWTGDGSLGVVLGCALVGGVAGTISAAVDHTLQNRVLQPRRPA